MEYTVADIAALVTKTDTVSKYTCEKLKEQLNTLRDVMWKVNQNNDKYLYSKENPRNNSPINKSNVNAINLRLIIDTALSEIEKYEKTLEK